MKFMDGMMDESIFGNHTQSYLDLGFFFFWLSGFQRYILERGGICF